LHSSLFECRAEFGNVEVDSELAKENAIATKEILNGCLVRSWNIWVVLTDFDV
jgi:hypothetical protein